MTFNLENVTFNQHTSKLLLTTVGFSLISTAMKLKKKKAVRIYNSLSILGSIHIYNISCTVLCERVESEIGCLFLQCWGQSPGFMHARQGLNQ